MTMTAERAPSPAAGSSQSDEQIGQVGTCDIAAALLTYNNADTLPAVLDVATRGLAERFPGTRIAVIGADSGSSDGSVDVIRNAGVPSVVTVHEAPLGERVAVP